MQCSKLLTGSCSSVAAGRAAGGAAGRAGFVHDEMLPVASTQLRTCSSSTSTHWSSVIAPPVCTAVSAIDASSSDGDDALRSGSPASLDVSLPPAAPSPAFAGAVPHAHGVDDRGVDKRRLADGDEDDAEAVSDAGPPPPPASATPPLPSPPLFSALDRSRGARIVALSSSKRCVLGSSQTGLRVDLERGHGSEHCQRCTLPCISRIWASAHPERRKKQSTLEVKTKPLDGAPLASTAAGSPVTPSRPATPGKTPSPLTALVPGRGASPEAPPLPEGAAAVAAAAAPAPALPQALVPLLLLMPLLLLLLAAALPAVPTLLLGRSRVVRAEAARRRSSF